MNRSPWIGKELTLADLGRLYQDLAGEWLLLEILDEGTEPTPRRLRLHAHHRHKEHLHEFMLEHEGWNWGKRYVLVQADPQKPCDIDLDAR